MAPQCSKCGNDIITRRYIKCCECECVFHVPNCISTVTDQRLDLMTPNRKAAWKCNPCKEPKVDKEISNTTFQDNNFEYVTTRHPKNSCELNVSTENSFESLPIDESEAEEDFSSIISPPVMNRSCPEISELSREVVKELENTILQLQQKLESADNEIINLLAENSSLVKLNKTYESKLKTLTQICSSPTQTTSKLKRKSCNRRQLSFNSGKTYTTPTGTNKIKKKLDNTEGEMPQTTNNAATTLTPNCKVQKLQRARERCLQNVEQSETDRINNLCIISSNKQNNVATTAISTFHKAKLCHFLTPNVGLEQLLVNLEKKVKNFTLYDSCVIMIGEKDFEVSMDYRNLVNILRTELLKIQHTNVFICLPTFRHGLYASLLFNTRIDTFNNLLYLDNMTHEYAYIIDSNKNLTYDSDMFTIFKGTLNNRGLRQIFNDLSLVINDVLLTNLDDQTTNSNIYSDHSKTDESEFFRISQ